MADESNANSWTDSSPTKGISLAGHDVQSLITGALLGATLGALFGHFLRKRSSEEPPIRVKGGSMTFEVLSNSMEWVGGGRAWNLSGGEKPTEKYVVSLFVAPGAQCNPQDLSGERVKLSHTGGWVELRGTGHHTHVRSSDNLSRSSDKKVLTYTPKGHIDRVEVDGFGCNLREGEFLGLLLFEA